MRFFLSTLLIAVLSFLIAIYLMLPWWSFALIAFIITLVIPNTLWRSFFSGFLAIFSLWALLALWINIKNEGLLTGKIAALFGLEGAGGLMVIISAFIGGLIAGLASMSAAALVPRHRLKRFP